MFGLTHTYGRKIKHPSPVHESRPYVERSHGYSIQSSVLQSSGAPEEVPGRGSTRMPMTRFDSEGDSGDYRLEEPGKEASEKAIELSPEPFRQPAGYDLQGIGGEKVKDVSGAGPKPMGRGTREELPLNTHAGYELEGSDYDHPGERGFRYRARFDGV